MKKLRTIIEFLRRYPLRKIDAFRNLSKDAERYEDFRGTELKFKIISDSNEEIRVITSTPLDIATAQDLCANLNELHANGWGKDQVNQ